MHTQGGIPPDPAPVVSGDNWSRQIVTPTEGERSILGIWHWQIMCGSRVSRVEHMCIICFQFQSFCLTLTGNFSQ